MENMNGFLVVITHIIDYIGCAVLIYGVIVSVIMLVRLVFSNESGHKGHNSFLKVRAELGRYLLLGLELMIAADVIHTVLEPSFEDVAMIFVIVIIRTVLSSSLSKEMESIHELKKMDDK